MDHRPGRRVINVSGHRLGTAEIESALVAHPHVAEAAVVGFPHDIKGQGIYAYVTLNAGVEPSDALIAELRASVSATMIGAIATPDIIHITPALPKTRAARSCAASCARSPRTISPRWATRRPWPIPSVVDALIEGRLNR